MTDSQWVTWSAWLSQMFVDADLTGLRRRAGSACLAGGSRRMRSSGMTPAGERRGSRHLHPPAGASSTASFDLVHPATAGNRPMPAAISRGDCSPPRRDLSGADRPAATAAIRCRDPARFAGAWESAASATSTQVVAYDNAGGTFAVRLWWMLRWLGHDAVALLDGGSTDGSAASATEKSDAETSPHAGSCRGCAGNGGRRRRVRGRKVGLADGAACSMRAARNASAARTRRSTRSAATFPAR
jgi:hypothetical protein